MNMWGWLADVVGISCLCGVLKDMGLDTVAMTKKGVVVGARARQVHSIKASLQTIKVFF